MAGDSNLPNLIKILSGGIARLKPLRLPESTRCLPLDPVIRRIAKDRKRLERAK